MTYPRGSTVILLRDWRDLSRGSVGEVRFSDDALEFITEGCVHVRWHDRRSMGPDAMPLWEAREVLEVLK